MKQNYIRVRGYLRGKEGRYTKVRGHLRQKNDRKFVVLDNLYHYLWKERERLAELEEEDAKTGAWDEEKHKYLEIAIHATKNKIEELKQDIMSVLNA
ncbi:MAG: hypothetical protein ACTSYD_02435 [Candidatus Heimdallarchaeaceae archaeon]